MPEEELLTFDQVCGEIAGKPARLLLGNGFSLAYDSSFGYENLKHIVFEKAFKKMDIEDLMLRFYKQPRYLVERLKEGFISAIGTVHPPWADDDKKKTCATFLKHFSKVYTLSYDLLLYWVINNDQELRDRLVDGFGFPKEQRKPNWPNAGKTSTFYLHGSLLLHCSKNELDRKACPVDPKECCVEKYRRPGSSRGLVVSASLIQILKSLSDKQIPHFVSEGSPIQKYLRIQNCTYLKGCYEALKSEYGNLVTYGVSFTKDLHILKAIKESNINCCYIGIHSDEKKLLQRIGSLRSDSRAVKVYDAKTAKVWQ